jgi:glycogen debranching enzyme
VRTLATSMRAYNPVSYHNGSVWPHDNALLAAGLARYGLHDAAHRLIAAQLDVATRLDRRLPELFAGFDRQDFRNPVAYPSSCSPQAWAAAAPLQWLTTVLGLRPDVPHGRLDVDPVLPDWLGPLSVRGIRVGEADVAVEVDASGVRVDGADAIGAP